MTSDDGLQCPGYSTHSRGISTEPPAQGTVPVTLVLDRHERESIGLTTTIGGHCGGLVRDMLLAAAGIATATRWPIFLSNGHLLA